MKTTVCEKCKSIININSKYCANCGHPNNYNIDKPQSKVYSIVGLIFSIIGILTFGLFSIVGLILSIIGFSKNSKNGNKDGTALAGIILSAIPLIFLFLVMVSSMLDDITTDGVELIDFSTITKYEGSKWCKSNGITCVFIEEYSDTVSYGKFIRQSIEPGQIVNEDATIMIVYSKGKEKKEINNEPKSETNNIEKYTLLESYISDESNEYFTYIEGKIKNNRASNLSYISVTFKLYDSEGNIIGSCIDNENNIGANEIWKFKALCTESRYNIARYELGEISAW